MRILGHVVLVYAILMIGMDYEMVAGGMARKLSLKGSAVIPFIPWAAIAMYAVIAFATRKSPKRWIRFGGIVAGYLFAGVIVCYPNWLFERYSKKIEIGQFLSGDRMFLAADEITNFELTFKTPTIQYSTTGGGPWLVVPQYKFSESMVSFLRDNARAELVK